MKMNAKKTALRLLFASALLCFCCLFSSCYYILYAIDEDLVSSTGGAYKDGDGTSWICKVSYNENPLLRNITAVKIDIPSGSQKFVCRLEVCEAGMEYQKNFERQVLDFTSDTEKSYGRAMDIFYIGFQRFADTEKYEQVYSVENGVLNISYVDTSRAGE